MHAPGSFRYLDLVARFVRRVWILVFAIVSFGCSAQSDGVKSGAPPPPPRSAPAPNAETAALLERLVTLAGSPKDEDQSELARQLGESRVLDQLDEPSARDRSRAQDLRLARVLEKLSANGSTHVGATLATLAHSEKYNLSPQRQELLVRALASRHPMPPACLAFLDAQARPDSVNLHLAIDALCENDSAAAWEVVGRKLVDTTIEPEYKVAWLRGPVLKQRRSVPLLTAADKWLSGSALDRELRHALAEALFDYRPDEWYPGREGLPRPPEEKSASGEAKTILRRLADAISKGDYPAGVQAAVRRTLKKLR